MKRPVTGVGNESEWPSARRVPEAWQQVRRQKAVLEREIVSASGDSREVSEGPGYLFIYGCPRSGTTAIAELLNRDLRIAVGLERFKYLDGHLHPFHFDPDYFLRPTRDETNILRPALYEELAERFDAGTVRLVGDKVVASDGARELRRVAAEFEPCRFLFLLRDLPPVAESFNRRASDGSDRNWPPSYNYRHAVRRWNDCLQNIRAFMEQPGGARKTHVLLYEDFFSGNSRHLHALYSFLGLEITDVVEEGYSEAVSGWSERVGRPSELSLDESRYLERRRDSEVEAWARKVAAEALV